MTTGTWAATLAVMLMAGAGTTHAQTVQKCVARDGHTRYQSEPCARGERTAEIWDATPDPVAPANDEPKPRTRAIGRTRSTSRRATHATTAPVDTRNRCADARTYRDAVERRVGLERNYALLSTLQERVFEACR